MSKTKNKGSCLCGQITFSVSEFLPSVGHCHCRMCQKFHGAAFSTFAEVKNINLHWLSGEANLVSYHAENDTVRKFCRNCGSSLLFESKFNRRDDTIEIALACFDTLEHIEPDVHIFTESKVDWLALNDQLPKYLKYRDSSG